MKVDFTPLKMYAVSNVKMQNNKMSFAGVRDNYGLNQPDDIDRFERCDEDYEFSDLVDGLCSESKFRNLPKKSAADRARELTFVDMLSGYDSPDEDDVLDRLTY